MKVIISKIFNFLKSLFLRLRVMVTLEFGRRKLREDGSNPGHEETETEKGIKYDR